MRPLHTSQISERGGRDYNEDYLGYWIGEAGACWVVADGLGGHKGGAIASRVAVKAVVASFQAHPDLSEAALRGHVRAAEQALRRARRDDPSLASMRTTLVALFTDHRTMRWLHIGDSRLYRFEGGVLAEQTKDHSVTQALVQAGDIRPEEVRQHEDRSKLLRALGNDDDVLPTFNASPYTIQDGDVFLLCTDGFWEWVMEAEMQHDLAQVADPEQWLQKLEGYVAERAAGTHHDNYTALAVWVRPDDAAEIRTTGMGTAVAATAAHLPEGAPAFGVASAPSPAAPQAQASAWRMLPYGGVAVLSLVVLASVLMRPSSPVEEAPVPGEGAPLITYGLPELTDRYRTNDWGINFRRIAAGSFTMGSDDAAADSDEQPPHEVTIDRDFFIGVHEVTQKQWYDVMGTRPWAGKPYTQEGDDYPATFVSSQDVAQFL